MKGSRLDWMIVAAVALVSVIAFALVAPGMGLNIDEGPYIEAGDLYAGWLVRFAGAIVRMDAQGVKDAVAAIPQYWTYNHEHPPLTKIVYGITGRTFGGLLGTILAARVGALFFLLVLQASLYFLIAPAFGRFAGAAGALAILSHPRLLAHGMMCEMDLPSAATVLLCTLLFVKGLERRRYAIFCGIAFGLALATKINGFFIFFPLVLWGYIFHRRKFSENFFWMSVLGPLTFVLTWPWLWSDTISRIIAFLQFQATHKFEPVYYMGSTYTAAPWHYPFVILLAATPLVILLFAAASLVRWREKPLDGNTILLLFLFLYPLLVVMPESVPVYNQMRLFLLSPVMLCGLAGVGAAVILERLQKLRLARGKATILAAGLGGLLIVPGFVGSAVTHPYELSSYGAAVGFRTGAVSRGFGLLHWAQVEPAVVRWLNQEFPQGAFVDGGSGAATVLKHYQALGVLSKKFTFGAGGDYWVICTNHSYSGFPRWWFLYYGLDPEYRPFKTFAHDGFRYVVVYRKGR
jgi:4-amino-4-deoxy-L-arabinose transferase-like glycosyltransferase